MSSQQTSLYIKIEKNSVVRDRNVRLSDVAKMTGTDTAMIRQLKQMKIYDEPLLNTSSGLDDILMIENEFYRNLYYWDDTKIQGKSYKVRLNTNYEADYEDDFITPDGVEHIKCQVKYRISLYSLSEEFYRYLKSLNDQKNNGLGNSELAPIRSTYTNVINGIGVVGGCRMFQTKWIDNLQEN